MTRALHACRATRTALGWFIMHHKRTPSNIRAQKGLRLTVAHPDATSDMLVSLELDRVYCRQY